MKKIVLITLAIKKHLTLLIEGARLKTLPAILMPVLMASAWAFYQTGLLKKDIFTFKSALRFVFANRHKLF